jgi:hypothetical protein
MRSGGHVKPHRGHHRGRPGDIRGGMQIVARGRRQTPATAHGRRGQRGGRGRRR